MSGAAEEPHQDPLVAAARELQQSHKIGSASPSMVPILAHLPTLSGWIARLPDVCARATPEASKAADWLLDNRYQIKRAVRQIHEDLPPRFHRRLPRLESTDRKGTPRIFALAEGFLAATHIQLSLGGLVQFVRVYQEGGALTIAELWALPTMLRLACLEILVSATAAIFPELRLPFEAPLGGSISELHEPTECIARALAGLRVVASIPWKDFFDRTSVVEEILRRDPAAVYPRMDFDTRDRYRKTIEELAQGSHRPECNVAESILAQAEGAAANSLRRHIGYWLLGLGRKASERDFGFRATPNLASRRWLLRHAGACYIIALLAVGLAALVVPAIYLWHSGASLPFILGGGALAIVPASIIATTVVHWAVTLIVPPRLLAKLDFDKAIPAELRIAVVMPVIVGNSSEVAALIERLELHWLANPDPSLRFALLSDPKDAPTERLPEDGSVESALIDGIRRLNDRHGRGGQGPFHLLHRARRFNPGEGCWMAWERKRGKLEEFNRMILGAGDSAFPLQEGETTALRGVRFVVTVDADTVLPPGSVARLVGTLAHPLNEPEFDSKTGQLCGGYTVIQPRVEITPTSVERSLFSRIYAGDNAIDIYSRAVSDIYQDLFGAAVYVGKGIYDVAAFHRCLESRVANNSLLSHDLLEGAHGRVALASDIVFYDGFPSGYIEYTRRWHRWVRGDWQLLPWLLRRVPDAAGKGTATGLSALERWKILDNLRRSIIPISLVVLAAAGWLALPGTAWTWTVLTIAAPAAYLFTDAISGLARGRRRGVLQSAFWQFAAQATRWFLAVVFLLNDALVSLDAIGRTLWRIFVSRRNLLNWTSAAHMAARLKIGNPRLTAWREMWMTPSVTAVTAVLLAAVDPLAFPAAFPLLLLWFASPEIAARISRPGRMRAEELEPKDRIFLRQIGRKTWLFFESFVGPDDNWLPPDNFQEDPRADIAHRTSPTNIGMYILSTLTAWDLGYLGTSDLAVRFQNTLDTLGRLERYRGHFLNWYDTRTLAPLEPRYVSTVDSGNLAVCFITLKQGCRDAANGPILRHARWDGLADTLQQLAEALEHLPGGMGDDLRGIVKAVNEHAASIRDKPDEWFAALSDMSAQTWAGVTQAISLPSSPAPGVLRTVQIWLERLKHHQAGMQRTFETLMPWIKHMGAPPVGCEELARQLHALLKPSASLAECDRSCMQALDSLRRAHASPEIAQWAAAVSSAIENGLKAQRELRQSLLEHAKRAEAMAYAMDFKPLYDPEFRLFHIGYNVSSDRLDQNFYDLLASEARLASYFAIAKHDVPMEHWFFLGRPITKLSGGPSLLSWNGSMFEYLMPTLLLRSSSATLLARSERSAVNIQRRYARKLGLPWGVSESGYAARDSETHYQYRAFGVPGLGLRRGLSQDLVVAPYATGLALAVYPVTAVHNLEELADLGLIGLYGFLEAGDFTPDRIVPGHSLSPVRAYMAHHQGMLLSAIGNVLTNDIHVQRFSSDMRMRTVDLLLQERVPTELPPELVGEEEPVRVDGPLPTRPPPRPWHPRNVDVLPQIHMLGNGRFASWISEAGGGGLWWHKQALTRWLPNAVRDGHGLWVYLHDEDSGAVWSAGRQPCNTAANDAQVIFHPHMAEFHRREEGMAVRMEVCVAPGDDLEIRRIKIVNETDNPRRLRITSYGEVVLAPARDDERHPAFSKLFVGCEHIAFLNGLLFTRRQRSVAEHSPVLLHRVVLDDFEPTALRFEADRSSFLGRHGDVRRPRGALAPLGGNSGWTLDPIMALQIDVTLKPRETRRLAFVTVASGSRESALELAERYATIGSLDWAFNDAAREAAHETQSLALEPRQLPEFQSLSSLLLAPQAALRGATSIQERHLGQSRLWAFGVSGDLPILLLRVSDARESELLRNLLGAHKVWRKRLFAVDLVILRTGFSGYEEPVRERVLSLIREAGLQDLVGRNGGIHLLFADQLTANDRAFLEATACAVLDDMGGPLMHQLSRAFETRTMPPLFQGTYDPAPFPMQPLARPSDLQFDNGFGGFSGDGSEYVIHLQSGEHTPAPWCNILANENFGTLVSESGGGFSWGLNSGEHRLTPWTNDPVVDTPGEVLYLRDEETAELWTPTPAPAGAETAHQIRHGAGYTRWLSRSHGMEHELTIFVAPDDPVKVARLRLTNVKDQPRRITASYYAEWLLGALRSVSGQHVVSHYDADAHAVFAHNSWNPEFGARVAFVAASHPPHSITTDRRDFIGREGNLAQPSGLLHWDLGGRVSPEGEPCAAFQVHLEIAAGGKAEVIFLLGEGRDEAQAKDLLGRWRNPHCADRAFEDLQARWNARLSALEVKTPDAAFDLMINRWLLYQTISSRILARAGFYQAGGAIGFRDQLQDVLAILHCEPARARAHLLDCAARQFEEGDVLHWWHPPQGRGVRTRCSDDLLWLPFVTSRYVEATGDLSIIEESVAFLRAPELAEEEGDRYALFEAGMERYPLFDHCLRALDRGVTRGAHGLPLMGSGDWNDGMNRVGVHGRGESVWLGWFAIATMDSFADLAARTARLELAEIWKSRADGLRKAIERAAWDGDWYVRAFDDDGHPLGSAANEECRIDSIAQSWSALADGRDPKRIRTAIASVQRELVFEKDRLICLLKPPFHESNRDPGYIKAYPPGIRENGGQYSHAAAWLGHALAAVGDGEGAWQIFDLLNPVRRTQTPDDAARYRGEPYVLAADIASSMPHRGRTGWTWYTGAAAWTWRLGVEGILGLRLHGDGISIQPCLPKTWRTACVTIKGPAGSLSITIQDPERLGQGLAEITVAGVPAGTKVAFPTDGSVRQVEVRLKRLLDRPADFAKVT